MIDPDAAVPNTATTPSDLVDAVVNANGVGVENGRHNGFGVAYSIIQDVSSSSGPFEGPEKLLELWFSPSPSQVPLGYRPRTRRGQGAEGEGRQDERLTGLRRVKREVWEGMLDEVRCKVLSVVEGRSTDAYLLSESSMFVWPHKLILKTCGTTTLLLGLPTLLRIAETQCGFDAGVWRCFYSRKTFMFPERQLGPHKGWGEEVKFLDGLFANGSAYTVGKMNGDHWLLYMTAPRADAFLSTSFAATSVASSLIPASSGTKPLTSHISTLRPSTGPRPPPPTPSDPDSTLEILMSHLSPRACEQFYCSSNAHARYPVEPLDGHAPGLALAQKLGLTEPALLGADDTGESVVCDAFLFSPCGFSVNLLVGEEGRYATVHVTPEEGWSYASFECNVDFSGNRGPGLAALVGKIVKMFEPGRFSLTLFISCEEGAMSDSDDLVREGGNERGVNAEPGEEKAHEGIKTALRRDLMHGYRRTDRIVYEFEGYDLVFVTFERHARA